MRLLLMGDVHLSTYPKFGQSDSSLLPTRLQEQKEVLDQVWDVILARGIDHVEFTGDWYHKDKEIPTECLNVTKEFFQRFTTSHVTFGATRGNHDLVNKQFTNSYQYSLSPFLPKHEEYPVLNCYRLHYDLPTDYEGIEGYDLVIAHKMPVGSKSPHSYVFDQGVDWRTLAKNNKLVVFGHNHHTQQLADNCFVIGSLMQLTFGDTHQAGVWLLDAGKLEFIPLKAKKFLTVTSDADVKEDGNYYRVLGDSKLQSSRVIAVKEPTYFEQRLKSNTLTGILKEWLTLQNKDLTYFDMIKDDLGQDLYNLQHIPDLTLTRVDIADFGPFKHAVLEVNNGLTLIEGSNEGFSSNGSGKSFLCDAIYYAITGETTKGITGDDVLRKYPKKQKDCQVEIRLSYEDTGEYVITRSRKNGLTIRQGNGVTSTILNDGLKLKESQEMLDRLLGFNKLTFVASTYFNQDQLLLLTKLGTAEKNSIITTLLGFENYDKLAETLLGRVNDLETQRLAQDRQIAALEGKLSSLRENLKSIQATEKLLLDKGLTKKTAVEEANQKLKTLEDVQDAPVEVDTFDFENELGSKKTVLTAVTDALTKVSERLATLNANPKLVELTNRCSELSTAISIERANEYRIFEEVEDIEEAAEGSICKYCGSTVTPEHRVLYLEQRREEVRNSQTRQAQLRLDLDTQSDSLTKLQKEIKYAEDDKQSLDKQVQVNRRRIDDLTALIHDALLKKSERSQKTIEIERQKSIIKSLETELVNLRADYKACKENVTKCLEAIKITEQDKGQKELSIVEFLKSIDILNFWREAVAYKGVKSLLLDGFCNDFNAILKTYVSDISNGVIFAEFSPISQTKSGESRNKLDLRIEIAGTERIYDSLSGGEKKRVDIAVCLSFSKWIQQRYNLKSSLLGIQIFDEIFDGLDSSAEDCLAPILQKEAENKAVFVISHTRELGSYADKVVTVQKRGMVAEVL